MMTMLSTVLIEVSMLITMGAATAQAEKVFTKIPSETGDYCTDQALGHMRYLFGDEVQIKKVFSESAGEKVAYWFETNVCEGHMVATYFKGSTCGGAHYGSIPLYMQRLYAHGDCQQVMSADSYPALETTFPFIVA